LKIHKSGRATLLAAAWTVLALPLVVQSGSDQPRVAGINGPEGSGVAALGRLEPEYGLIRLGAPATLGATTGVLIGELAVDEGDLVQAGDLIAITDTASMMKAAVYEAETRVEQARQDARASRSRVDEACALAEVREQEALRRERLREDNAASREEAELARAQARAVTASCSAAEHQAEAIESRIPVATASLERARTELERTRVTAPFDGRIIEVLARPGELVRPEGIVELGRVDRMLAIAEVYEADIGRVELGQRARISSPALAETLTGRVERIRHKVQKLDQIGTDPAARQDARIVEVEILIDDPEPAAALTNLQVTVLIET